MKKLLFPLFAVALLFAACATTTGPDGNGDDSTMLTGHVYAADGETPIPGVTVSLDYYDLPIVQDFQTTTDSEGKFRFTDDLPDGTALLRAQKGGFYEETEVIIPDDFSSDVDMDLEIDESKIGVVPGSFDDIGAILNDLGYGYTTLTDAQLANWDNLDPLDMLFLNCGSSTWWAESELVQTNLDRFVDEGGYLYASDWEWVYVEAVWPDAVLFLDEDDWGPEQGEEGTYTGEILRQELEDYLGSSTVDILYDLAIWAVIEDVGSDTEVLIQGDIDYSGGSMNDSPLMVDFEYGSGKVGYTTFHNEAQLNDQVRTVLVYFIFNQPEGSRK